MEPATLMDFLDDILEARKARLGQSPLCACMADRRVDPCQRLSFIPAMLFFTMGFKDILAALREPGMAERLHHFGRVHQHAEASHARDQDDALHPHYVPTEDERTTAHFLVNQVFETFRRMFDCWHAARLVGQAMRPAA